jgi:hypothetical protein
MQAAERSPPNSSARHIQDSAEDEQRTEYHQKHPCLLNSSLPRARGGSSAGSFLGGELNGWGRLRVRWFNSAGLSLGFEESVERFTAQFEPMLLECGGLLRPGKSGGPPLLEPSLKVQGDSAHKPETPGFAFAPTDLNARCAQKVLHGPAGITGPQQQPQLRSDGAKLPFEIYEGTWLRFVGKTVEKPA